jgi:hypothetical protein
MLVGDRTVGAERIDENDVEVRAQERKVVVAAVPQQDVRFRLGRRENGGVIDAGEDQRAGADVRLVLLPFLHRAVGVGEVVEGGKSLDRLAGEVAVRHGVTQSHDP